VQTRVQCNDNSTRSYENQSVHSHRDVSKLVKTAINTAITVKLLKYKMTLLNTCQKLKMTQRDTGNIKSKVNETCYCEHVTIRLKCGSGWSGSTERMGIKCVLLMM
jgi:hypothetical protein